MRVRVKRKVASEEIVVKWSPQVQEAEGEV